MLSSGIIVRMKTKKTKENTLDPKMVIKGGYYIAPSGPAKPLIKTSSIWGTASEQLKELKQTKNTNHPAQQKN